VARRGEEHGRKRLITQTHTHTHTHKHTQGGISGYCGEKR
jgi:hypothetical protein